MNDKLYRILLFAAALVVPIVCGGVVYALVTDAHEAFEHFGFFNFLTSSEWSYTEGAEQYGALPFITGTLMTTLLALVFCIPFSLPVALFVGEYFKGTSNEKNHYDGAMCSTLRILRCKETCTRFATSSTTS